jgi:glycosyltransferase involved in cell wall biosynthesis
VRVLVVVPAHNEAPTVAAVVDAARQHAPVLVVDDGSTDGTAAAAAAAGAEVLRHRRRLGKGQALRTGFAAARARGATHVLTLDADGQHDAADVPALLAAAGPRTIVVGTRLPSPALSPARAHANRIAGFFVRWVSGLCLPDTQCGLRLYPVAVSTEVPTRRGGFVFETEVLIAAAARGFAVRTVPVRARPRAVAHSRFRPLLDGAAVAAYLGACTVRRFADEAVGAAGVLTARAARALTPAAAAPVAARSRGARRRRAGAAAVAVAALPLALPVVLIADLAGRRLPALAARMLGALYDPDRLGPADPPPAAGPAVVSG